MQKYISPDQLPAAYGGTRCEPDPYCTKYVRRDMHDCYVRSVEREREGGRERERERERGEGEMEYVSDCVGE